MRKTFRLTKGKHAPDRVIDGIKANIRKYIKRERGKALPAGMDFWDFECKIGTSEETAQVAHVSSIGKAVDDSAAASTTETIYVQIEATGKRRNPSLPKPKPAKNAGSKPKSTKPEEETEGGKPLMSAEHARREQNAPPQIKK